MNSSSSRKTFFPLPRTQIKTDKFSFAFMYSWEDSLDHSFPKNTEYSLLRVLILCRGGCSNCFTSNPTRILKPKSQWSTKVTLVPSHILTSWLLVLSFLARLPLHPYKFQHAFIKISVIFYLAFLEIFNGRGYSLSSVQFCQNYKW